MEQSKEFTVVNRFSSHEVASAPNVSVLGNGSWPLHNRQGSPVQQEQRSLRPAFRGNSRTDADGGDVSPAPHPIDLSIATQCDPPSDGRVDQESREDRKSAAASSPAAASTSMALERGGDADLSADEYLPAPWQESQGWNRLHVAAYEKAPDWKIRLLLEADPTMATEQNSLGNCPLHEGLAARADERALAALMSGDGRRAARIVNKDGELPLHIACECGTTYQVMRALVEANPEAIATQTHKTDDTPLHYLMRFKMATLSDAKLLLDVRPDAARLCDRVGRTPFLVGRDEGVSLDILNAVYDAFPEAAGLVPHQLRRQHPAVGGNGTMASGKVPVPMALKFQDGLQRGAQWDDELRQYEPQGLRLQHKFNMLHVALSKQAPEDTVLFLLESNPRMAMEKNTDGNTPLIEGLQAGANEGSLIAVVEACRDCCAVVNDNHECPLHYAVRKSSPKLIMKILRAFPEAASMQTFNEDDMPLHRLMGGSQNHDARIVREVMAEYANAAKVRDRYGRTPLHVAINNKAHETAVLEVFHAFPEAVGIQDAQRRTPLDEAKFTDISPEMLQHIQQEYVRACDRRGFRVNDILKKYKPGSAHVNQGWNALHIAMARGATADEIDAILQSSPNMARKQNDAGNFPLFEGFEKADVHSLVNCLDAYPDVCMVPNNNGELALHLAARSGHPIIIETISHVNPAAINLQTSISLSTPLHVLVSRQFNRAMQNEAIQLLLSSEALEARDSFGNTPLHIAIKSILEPTEIDCLFLPFPEAARIPDNEGRLPLHSAIQNEYPEEQLMSLLEAFPDAAKHTCGEDNLLPLHLAMKHRSGSTFTSSLIECYSAAPTIESKTGSTALSLGLSHGAQFESVFNLLKYKGAAKIRDSEGMMPLHIAMMKGAPTELVNLVLEAYPDAVKFLNVQGHTPFHAGIVPAVHVLKERYPNSFQPHEVRGGLLHKVSLQQGEVGRGDCALEDLLTILHNLNTVLESFPSVAEQKDSGGYLPLLHFCMVFNPSVVAVAEKDEQKAVEAITDTFVKIYTANPAAAEVVGPFVGNPINVLVGECSVATDISKVIDGETCKRLKILLRSARDGRALQSLCTLENKVSLWAFFSLFDESGLLDSKTLHGKLVVNLNKEAIMRWSLLDILADFDTQDSASVLLQIVVKQKRMLDGRNQVFHILNEDGDTVLKFTSLDEVSDTVKTRIADRAKLSNSSSALKRWGQEYGRFLRKYRLEKLPKHVSENCVVVFGTEATREEDGRMKENPVALKFMCSRDTFRREVEKRKNTESKYVVPIKASYSSVAIDDFECTKVNLQAELAPYPDIALPDSVLKYVIVMDCGAGFDLHDFISHQNVAGKDRFAVTSIAKEIALCLKFLNERCGTIHGDVKARNFVARGVGLVGFAAIDLDNAASIGREQAGKKRTSSGYLPPEQAALEAYNRSEQKGEVSFPQSDENGITEPEPLDALMKQILDASSRSEIMQAAENSFIETDDKMPPASILKPMVKPEYVIATPQYDMWCFGVLLYFLCTGKQLFNVDTKEDVDDDDLVKIRDWDDNWKKEKLSKVGKGWPLKLLDSLLQKDPRMRPENWKQVIDELNRLTNRDDNIVYDRVVVFQSAPLVYINKNNDIVPLPRLDFNQESEMLREALRDAESFGCTIEVVFETASLDRLNAFLAQDISKVFHFSGHGHPTYLAWEDEKGGLKMVFPDALKRMVQSTNHSMQLVFIAACHSEWVGNAFIDAGVPHAVCCLVDEQLQHVAASEFSRNFYRALACRKTLLKAFEFAQEAVMNSPHVENSESEACKFLLLPQKLEDPSYHDVPVFFTGIPPVQEDWGKGTLEIGLPKSKNLVVGREVEQYSVLNNLISTDVVRVYGEAELGKTATVAAVCQHMLQRPRSYTYDYFFWLPATGEMIANDVFYQSLCEFVKLTMEADSSPSPGGGNVNGMDPRMQTVRSTIAKLATQKSVLMILDIREYEKQQKEGEISEEAQRNLHQVVKELLGMSAAKSFKVVLICEHVSTKWKHPREERVPIFPLDLESAVTLFAYNVPATVKRKYPILNSREDFIAYICHPPEEIQMQDDYDEREEELFERFFGGGIPRRCREVAQRITDDKVFEILHWWEASEERESLIPLDDLFID